MQFVAKARYVWYSPYKLRPLADVVRGKNVEYALGWLSTNENRRTVAFEKVIKSAASNAESLKSIGRSNLFIKEIKVDQGPYHKYYKPGAQGRAMPQRKRMCHISVVLETLK